MYLLALFYVLFVVIFNTYKEINIFEMKQNHRAHLLQISVGCIYIDTSFHWSFKIKL